MTDQQLIERWHEFVLEVERGYELSLKDYRDQLNARALIAQRNLDSAVREDDGRYQKILTARGTRIWETPAAPGYWEFGYPSNTKGELLADLQAEGLL